MTKAAKPMTAREAIAAFEALRVQVGPSASLSVFMATWGSSEGALHCVLRTGLPGLESPELKAAGDDWETLLGALTAAWEAYRVTHAERVIRKMALAIIEITADQGACNEAALRQARFTAAEIETYGMKACQDAAEIASSGPFTIVTVESSNSTGEEQPEPLA